MDGVRVLNFGATLQSLKRDMTQITSCRNVISTERTAVVCGLVKNKVALYLTYALRRDASG